jgi:hypothetical protein
MHMRFEAWNVKSPHIADSLKSVARKLAVTYILPWRFGGSRMQECGLDSSGSRYSPCASSCEHDDDPLDFIRCELFLISSLSTRILLIGVS